MSYWKDSGECDTCLIFKQRGQIVIRFKPVHFSSFQYIWMLLGSDDCTVSIKYHYLEEVYTGDSSFVWRIEL